MIHSNNIFVYVPDYKNRLMPQDVFDTRVDKPGIRIYGRIIGLIFALFNFAVKLEAQNKNGDLHIWYVNKKSLKDWKNRQENGRHLNQTISIFKTPGALDAFIQLIKEDINFKKRAKEGKQTESNSKKEQPITTSKTTELQELNNNHVPKKETPVPNGTSSKPKQLHIDSEKLSKADSKKISLEHQTLKENDQTFKVNSDQTQETSSTRTQIRIDLEKSSKDFTRVCEENQTSKENEQAPKENADQTHSSTHESSEALHSTQPTDQNINQSGVENNETPRARYIAALKAKLVELKDFIINRRDHEEIDWQQNQRIFQIKNYPRWVMVTERDYCFEDLKNTLPFKQYCEEKNLELLWIPEIEKIEINESQIIYAFKRPNTPENQAQLWEQKKDKLVETFKELTRFVLDTKCSFELFKNPIYILEEERSSGQKITFLPKKFNNRIFEEILYSLEYFILQKYPKGLLSLCKTREQISAVLEEASITHGEAIERLIDQIYVCHHQDTFPSSKTPQMNQREVVIETILYQNILFSKYLSEGIQNDKFKILEVDFDTLDINLGEEEMNEEHFKIAIENIVTTLNVSLKKKELDEVLRGNVSVAHEVRKLILPQRSLRSILTPELVRSIFEVLQRGGYVIDFKREEGENESHWVLQI